MKKYFPIFVSLLISLPLSSQINKIESSKYPKPVTFTNEEDHADMMNQLGIKKLRPGPSGNESAPNHANYDETIANPCPILPDLLTSHEGKKITTADMWWKARRPEISCEDTLNALAGSSIVCAPIDSRLFMTYTAYLIESGFLNLAD